MPGYPRGGTPLFVFSASLFSSLLSFHVSSHSLCLLPSLSLSASPRSKSLSPLPPSPLFHHILLESLFSLFLPSLGLCASCPSTWQTLPYDLSWSCSSQQGCAISLGLCLSPNCLLLSPHAITRTSSLGSFFVNQFSLPQTISALSSGPGLNRCVFLMLLCPCQLGRAGRRVLTVPSGPQVCFRGAQHCIRQCSPSTVCV